MASIDFKADFAPALVAWPKRILVAEPFIAGGRKDSVIWGRPNKERPLVEYISFDLITPLIKIGSTDSLEHVADTTFNRGGNRAFDLQVTAYSKDQADYFEAIRFITLLQDSLEDINELATLRAANLAVWLIGDIVDTSELLESGYEPRASFDVRFGIESNRTMDLGKIEKVNLTPKINGTEDPEFEIS